jgi:hypothetical protein
LVDWTPPAVVCSRRAGRDQQGPATRGPRRHHTYPEGRPVPGALARVGAAAIKAGGVGQQASAQGAVCSVDVQDLDGLRLGAGADVGQATGEGDVRDGDAVGRDAGRQAVVVVYRVDLLVSARNDSSAKQGAMLRTLLDDDAVVGGVGDGVAVVGDVGDAARLGVHLRLDPETVRARFHLVALDQDGAAGWSK